MLNGTFMMVMGDSWRLLCLLDPMMLCFIVPFLLPLLEYAMAARVCAKVCVCVFWLVLVMYGLAFGS